MPTPETGSADVLERWQQDEHTRNRLLRAAVQVFDRKGFASASVREIVELAGVTKPALYYHFGNKDGVLTAILEEGAREFRAAIARAVGRSGGTRDRLFALFDEVNGLFEKNVPVARVAHAVIQGPAEGVPRFDFSVFDRSWEGALQTILEAGRAAGDVRQSDPEDAVLALTGVLSLCAARHLHPQYQSIGQARLRRVVEAVCDGLLVPGPGVASAAAPGA